MTHLRMRYLRAFLYHLYILRYYFLMVRRLFTVGGFNPAYAKQIKKRWLGAIQSATVLQKRSRLSREESNYSCEVYADEYKESEESIDTMELLEFVADENININPRSTEEKVVDCEQSIDTMELLESDEGDTTIPFSNLTEEKEVDEIKDMTSESSDSDIEFEEKAPPCRRHVYEATSTRPFPPPLLSTAEERSLIDAYIDATNNSAMQQSICCVCCEHVFQQDTQLCSFITNHDLLIPEGETSMRIYHEGISEDGSYCICNRCDHDLVRDKIPAFCRLNFDLGESMPSCIKGLTLAESILISIHHVKYYVFTDKIYNSTGQRKSKGHIVSYDKDMTGIIEQLPLHSSRLPESIKIWGQMPPGLILINTTGTSVYLQKRFKRRFSGSRPTIRCIGI